MSTLIETKRKTIEIKRENKINGGKKAFILFSLIIFITLYNHGALAERYQ